MTGENTNSDARTQNPMVQRFSLIENKLYREAAGNDTVYIDFDLVINGGGTSATLTETINNQLDYLSLRISDESGNEAVLQMDVVDFVGTIDLSGLNQNQDWTIFISYRAARLNLQDRNRITDYVQKLTGTKAGVTYEFTNKPETATIALEVDGTPVANAATFADTATVGEDKKLNIVIKNPSGVPVDIQAVKLAESASYTATAIPTTVFFIKEGDENNETVIQVNTSAAVALSEEFVVKYWDGLATQEYLIQIDVTVS